MATQQKAASTTGSGGSSKSSDKKGFSTGSVNVDSIKGILHRFVDLVTIPDETEAKEIRDSIDRLHSSGDPAEARKKEAEKAEKEKDS